MYSQTPNVEWSETYGSSQYDRGCFISQANPNNYIVVGFAAENDGDIHGSHGLGDIWLLMLNTLGDTIWTKCIGGSQTDAPWSAKITNDGGYIIAGYTSSIDGDATGNIINGGMDFWFVKTDQFGNIQWHKNYGGSGNEVAYKIIKTNDNGYIATGHTGSNNFDVYNNHGNYDLWVLKLDEFGDTLWTKCYGGSLFDYGRDIKQTNDNGYIILGKSDSNDGDLIENNGGSDYWILKIDSIGNIEWQKTYGGSQYDYSSTIIQTEDNGYIVMGRTESSDLDVGCSHGESDIWILRLTPLGDTIWTNCYGGSSVETASSMIKSINGGYIIAGGTASNDFDVSNSFGSMDAWIFEITEYGDLIWEKSIGGTNSDQSVYVDQISAIELVATGSTRSSDFDFPDNNGEYDLWVAKLSLGTNISNNINNSINEVIFPNPTTGKIRLEFEGIENIGIWDIHGNKVYKGKENDIDLSSEPRGIYIIKITTDKKTITQKLIKQ